MAISTFRFEELEESIQNFLHDARTRAGRGMPGLYIHRGNSKPTWAIIVGPIVGFGLFFLTLGSFKDAWAVAMLQTAGLLLGGWITLYAFRRWTAGRSRIYGGYFIYCDPLHIYDVAGENVTVISLENVQSVIGQAVDSGGRVDLDLGYDQHASINTPTQSAALMIGEYYENMAELVQSETGPWSTAPVAELGAAAKHTYDFSEIPANPEVLNLDYSNVPRLVEKGKRAGWGFGPILLLFLASAGLYGVLWAANIPLQDELAFSDAKANGAPGLRGYLNDPRNTRNRAEAGKLLAGLYDRPIANLKASSTNNPPLNPKSREGLILILEALKTEEGSPIVTMKVDTLGMPPTPAGPRNASIGTDLADSFGQTIGVELIQFAQPPEGVNPHILIEYEQPRIGQQVQVKVSFRLDPTAEKPEMISQFALPNDAAMIPIGGGVDQLAVKLAMELAGDYRSRPLFVPDFE